MIGVTKQLSTQNIYKYPLFGSAVSAGFPSPADEFIEAKLDLNELLVKHPTATFFMRVSGNSMQDYGIHDRDILIVDRSLVPTHGKIVIAVIDGQLTIKRLKKIEPENEIYIWGIVTYIIHNV